MSQIEEYSTCDSYVYNDNKRTQPGPTSPSQRSEEPNRLRQQQRNDLGRLLSVYFNECDYLFAS